MQCDLNFAPIQDKINSTSLYILSDDQIRAMSHCTITEHRTFDEHFCEIPSGALDTRMGGNVLAARCSSCCLANSECPGHFGHLELPYPIFNPFFINYIQFFLESVCIFCGKLKIKRNASKLEYSTFELILDSDMTSLEKRNAVKFLMSKGIKSCIHCNAATHLIGRTKTVAFFATNAALKAPIILLPQKIKEIFSRINEFQPFFFKAFFDQSKFDFNLFFRSVIPVTANFTRPLNQRDQSIFDNSTNENLSNIILLSKLLTDIQAKKANKTNKISNTENVSCYTVNEVNKEENTKKKKKAKTNTKKTTSNTTNTINPNTDDRILEILNAIQETFLSFMDKSEKTSTSQIYNKPIFFAGKDSGRRKAIHVEKDIARIDSIRENLEKKSGLFRNNLMGKRVDFGARSVISPDCSVDTSEIGIPFHFAKTLTLPESVNRYNLAFLKQCIENGSDKHPGASHIMYLTQAEEQGFNAIVSYEPRHIPPPRVCHLKYITASERVKLAASLNETSGVIVHRHLIDGDVVLVNRQPTLHKVSIMAHKIKILKNQSVIRLHVANCKSYNADFDGDEMNLFLPQNEMARVEALQLALSAKQFVSTTGSGPMRGLVQDYIVSSVKLTQKSTMLTKKDFKLLLGTFYKYTNVPLPFIVKPVSKWSGKQLFTEIIKITLNKFDKENNLLRHLSCSKVGKDIGEEESTVVIINSVLLHGVIGKEDVGNSKFGFIHLVYELLGSGAAEFLISGVSRVYIRYLQMQGFSCGLKDLRTKKETNAEKVEILKEAGNNCKQTLLNINGNSTYNDNKEKDNNNNKKVKTINDKLTLFNLVKNTLLQSFLSSQTTTEELIHKSFEVKIKNEIYSLTNQASSLILPKGLESRLKDNGFHFMIASGSKGNPVNLHQIACNLGQQELEGKRAPRMLSGKTLPSFFSFDLSPRSGGFIEEGFFEGISLDGFFFHCMAGREGLVDTNVKTSVSGYLERSMVKHLESLRVHYDMTLRDDAFNIVQFKPGDDGIEAGNSCYLYNIDKLIENRDLLTQTNKNTNNTDVNINDNDKYEKYLSTYNDKINNETKLVLRNKYNKALLSPGCYLGVETAQALGEPATQMTLNTFHLAGHGESNVTMGIPRLRQLIDKGTKQEESFSTYFELKEEMKYDKTINDKIAFLFKKRFLNGYIKHLHIKEDLIEKNQVVEITFYFKYLFEVFNICQEFGEENIHNFFETNFEDIIAKFFKKLREALISHLQDTLNIKTRKIIGLNVNNENENVENKNENKKEPFKMTEELLNKTKPKKDILLVFNNKTTKLSMEQFVLSFRINKPKDGASIINLEGDIIGTAKAITLNKNTSIKSASVIKIEEEHSYKIMLSGNALEYLIENFAGCEVDKVYCNDVHVMSEKYGIEAGRQCLINEIQYIYNVYNISINSRYLSIIGDFMTRTGIYQGMNRHSETNNSSLWQKATFETALKILKDAAVNEEKDIMENPSSNLIFGQAITGGTNSFDVYFDLNFGERNKEIGIES
eukprot:GAHX01002075.1.p1 GENE.GAHX01002075.1~~GAHX01002075.1.p1  ORF type:complete len:1518 (+),score=337.65 GAHX01002075.1:38-4555(+)